MHVIEEPRPATPAPRTVRTRLDRLNPRASALARAVARLAEDPERPRPRTITFDSAL